MYVYSYVHKLVLFLGPDELVVESAIFGAITIKANVDADSPDAICQKVCSAAKIPTPNICLYTRYVVNPYTKH